MLKQFSTCDNKFSLSCLVNEPAAVENSQQSDEAATIFLALVRWAAAARGVLNLPYCTDKRLNLLMNSSANLLHVKNIIRKYRRKNRRVLSSFPGKLA